MFHKSWSSSLCSVSPFLVILWALFLNTPNGRIYHKGEIKFHRYKKQLVIFKVCKSVHHRTIQINHHLDAIIFQFIILTFVYSSTCFGRFTAHYQELNDCSVSLWFYLRFVVTVVLCSWSGRPAGPTTNTARLSPRYEDKTRGCHCSHWAPDDGRENARNMLSCKQTPG
jgi:hypothetical protein